MGTITLETTEATDDVRFLVRSAIASEIAKLELGLVLAQQRLRPFEQKYHVSSERFIAEFAAEDLESGDDEYVRWAGEYQLKQRLEAKLAQLNE